MTAPDLLTLNANLNPRLSKKFYRPTWAEISAGAFSSNLRRLQALAGRGVGLVAVLKADAYGHGAVELAKLVEENAVAAIGVSSIEEGLALRDAGIKTPIILLGGIYPLENFSVAIDADLTPTVASYESAQHLKTIAEEKGRTVSFHLKVDTGMGRIGVSPIGAKKIIEWVADQPSLELAGVYSHFACADGDQAFTTDQLNQFLKVKDLVRQFGFARTKFHIANSAALIRFPESRLDLVRPGLSLYGAANVSIPPELDLLPVMSLKTKITFLKKVPTGTPVSYGGTFKTKRDSEIATLPIGYADGVPRELSNKGAVLVKGRRCPIVGRVTMDQIMVDVTGVPVDVGDEIVLIGRQNEQDITVQEWADWAGTIPYEIFCGISKRVPRVMVD